VIWPPKNGQQAAAPADAEAPVEEVAEKKPARKSRAAAAAPATDEIPF
jgi:hypothetical protein